MRELVYCVVFAKVSSEDWIH